jgi:small subunit ribosomal protein S6
LNEYELLYIVSPRVPADDVANAIERVNALVTAQGGEVLSVDNWGRRRLAYPIRQYFEGTYVLMTLKMPPTGAVGIEAGLRLSEEVIRHLLIAGIIPRTSGGRPREEREEREQAFEGTSTPAPIAAEAPASAEAEAEAEAPATEAPAEAEAPAAEAEPAPAAAE